MVDFEKLHSVKLERHVLSSLLNHPELFSDVDGHLQEKDFIQNTHQVIFSVIRSILSKGDKIDNVLVAQKIKNLGIQLGDNIDIFSYLGTLKESQITDKAGKDACKEIIKLRIRREIYENADRVKEFVVKNGELKMDELIAGVDKLQNEKLNLYHVEEEPIDLYGTLADLIIERGNNPINETGLITPYDDFNRLFGGIRACNGIYAVVSRPKHGKSTWLLNMAEGITFLNADTIALYLDTEMQTEVSQYRATSAASQVPMWFVETGNFKKNRDLNDKILKALPEFEKFRGKVFHLNVKNRPVEEICSLIRRFYYKRVGRSSGRRLLVIYDYLKLTGEKLSNNWAEHQAVGEKINYLNDVGNELPNTHLWAAMQLNRSAEDGRDDSSAIAVSDRLQWFAAFVAIFRRKWPDEIGEDGLGFGTHKMIPTATRFQGREAAGHHDLINIGTKQQPKYVNNFLNFEISNFKISDKGTLTDIVNARNQILKITKKKNNDDNGSF